MKSLEKTTIKIGPMPLLSVSSPLMKKLAAVMKHCKAAGAKYVGFIGFCWGAWAAAQLVKDYPDPGPYGEHHCKSAYVVCAVLAHPSIHGPEELQGRDPMKLAKGRASVHSTP